MAPGFRTRVRGCAERTPVILRSRNKTLISRIERDRAAMCMRIFIVLLPLLPSAALAQSGEAALHSPNGQLAITFRTVTISPGEDGDARKVETVPAGGQLVYQVTFHGKPVMEPSSLRLDLTGQPPLGANVRIANFAAENG